MGQRLRLTASLCLLSILLSASAAAASPPIAAESEHEPSEVSVPAGAVRAFIDAARAGDYRAAAERLDLSRLPAQQPDELGPGLARKLKVVLDRRLWIDYDELSEREEGAADDGLAADLDRIGTITNGRRWDLLLRRVADEEGRRVWKFAPSTVAAIEPLYDAHGYGWLGDKLPPVMFDWSFLEIRLAQWIGLLLLSLAAYLGARVAVWVLRRLVRPVVARTRSTLDDRLLDRLATPSRVLVAVGLFTAGSLALRLAEPVQPFVTGIGRGLVLVALAWIALRAIEVGTELLDARFLAWGRPEARAILPLARRVAQGLLIAIAAISALQNLGFNVTGLIAGLGVGGLALALASQKTVENLLGGVTLFVDQPVRIGDFCRFADGKLGTVEEIGMRSTRIRTLDRTLVSIPNSRFAELELENYAMRDRIWLSATIGLRYETSGDQLRFVLAGLRKMLVGHPRVCSEPLRVRLAGFGASSLDVELFAYVDTRDFNEFTAIREDILLRVIDVVEQAGTGFAFPSRTVYLGRDSGLDREACERAEASVRRWRETGTLPFPDLPDEEAAAIRDRLDYPPAGSPGS
ncbi:MAG TPA: mechanosensitive ion channel family protein [Candidatus Polarisedimenticolaceae bacterium]|nr:mechanosensitive ion channel family protein [Candidatus Polarisedimenticolaceae bacterium]